MKVATRPAVAVKLSNLRVSLMSAVKAVTNCIYGVDDAVQMLRMKGVPEAKVHMAENVKEILKELQVDNNAVVAGVLRDMPVSEAEVRGNFGDATWEIWRRDKEFRELMASKPAANVKLSLFSLFGDFPCLVIELAHAVANLRLKPRASRDLNRTREDLENVLRVHVPLADTLGCWALQSELEELAFMHLNPEAYDKLDKRTALRLHQYGPLLGCTVRELEYTLSNLPAFRKVASFRVGGRIKNKFSIYQKMRSKQLKFEEVLDFVALRIILNPKSGVSEEEACYKVLKEIQRRWPTVEGSARDYIANPKDNGYESLHTTIVASGLPVEIQIRTERMHENSEFGNASHQLYKVESLPFF